MERHQQKLKEIKKENKKTDAKRVDQVLQKRHLDKVRTFEFIKQGMQLLIICVI
jgi:hypothetical protein